MDSRLAYATQPLKTWFYLVLISVFILNQIAEVQGYSSLYQRGYLDDVLVVPIVLPFVLFILRLLFFKQIRFINFVMLASFIFLLSIVFELILPRYSVDYTADVGDVICYVFGGLVFWTYQHYLYQQQIA